MQKFTVHLRDLNAGLVEAWREAFAGCSEFQIEQKDVFDFTQDAIPDAVVSPANSFGYMDGGIDAHYTKKYGTQMQERLQIAIKTYCDGEVPVGQALVLHSWETAPQTAELPRFLVCAPTMRVPQEVRATVNAYLAFRATLLAVRNHNLSQEDKIFSIVCPGLATGVGKLSARNCALQMRQAWDLFLKPEFPRSWLESCWWQERMLKGVVT